jgi:hypothetical protein
LWFFINNEASRYLFLSKAFRSTPHDDLDISTYASKLQRITDDLAAIGCPVDDRDLTLQFIDGLGPQFMFQAKIMKTAVPTFSDACSRLQNSPRLTMPPSNNMSALRLWTSRLVVEVIPPTAAPRTLPASVWTTRERTRSWVLCTQTRA